MSVCACIRITKGCSGQNAADCAVSAISTGVWVLSAAVAGSEGPRHGCALGKPPLPCAKRDKTRATRAARVPGWLFSRLSAPHSPARGGSAVLWVLQSSCKGKAALGSLPRTAGSLSWSCGWSRRGVSTF